MPDHKLTQYQERLRSLTLLPTPHGRALAPWRELVEDDIERGLPCLDRLSRQKADYPSEAYEDFYWQRYV